MDRVGRICPNRVVVENLTNLPSTLWDVTDTFWSIPLEGGLGGKSTMRKGRLQVPKSEMYTSQSKEGSLVDPASSHMLVSKIKPCMSQYKHLHGETANGSLKQLWFI